MRFILASMSASTTQLSACALAAAIAPPTQRGHDQPRAAGCPRCGEEHGRHGDHQQLLDDPGLGERRGRRARCRAPAASRRAGAGRRAPRRSRRGTRARSPATSSWRDPVSVATRSGFYGLSILAGGHAVRGVPGKSAMTGLSGDHTSGATWLGWPDRVRTRVDADRLPTPHEPRRVHAVADTDIETLTRADVPDDWTELDRRAVDTIRVLAADAVQKVGNGHPGTAMSLAPLAYALFQRVMRHDPSDPDWIGRDRFVLSAGHSSLTLYIQLYLSGYGLELDDLKALRTWGSQDPRPPRARPHPRRGDHHRAAGPGPGLGGRDGDGGPPRARPVRPGRRARREPVRPPDLRDRLGRRHRGGRHLRGVVAGRHPAAGQPHGDLRRQPDLHRGRHRRSR